MPESPPQLLTTPEVAARLRVNVKTVRRLCASGQLPAYRIGREYRVDPAAVGAYLTGQRP